MKTPFTQYRPTRTADDSGGFTEGLSSGTVLWGTFELHKDIMRVVGIQLDEDIIVSDIITTQDNANYRVMEIVQVPGTIEKTAMLERIDKPIHP